MENRKCIAVLTEKPSLDYQSGILKGIYRSAFSHDANVAVFCVTSTRSDEAYQIGEMVIFSLLGDYSQFFGRDIPSGYYRLFHARHPDH